MADVDISDLPAPPVDISDLPAPPPRVSGTAETLLGPGELIGNTIANIPHAAAHSAVDMYRRLTGGDTNAPDPAAVQALEPTQYGIVPSAAGKQLAGDIKDLSGIGGEGSPIDAALRAQHEVTSVNPLSDSARATAGDVINQASTVAGDVGNLAPVAGALKNGVSAISDMVGAKPAIAEAAQTAANKAAAAGNAGAAGTAVDTSKLSPETQAQLARLGAPGGVNPTALSRVHEAESLPVPMSGERGLTAGQATGDSATISDEFNRKGEHNNAIGNRYDAQDQGLKDNLAEIHRNVSPLTVANNDVQNGQAAIDSLKRYDQPKVAAITAAYDDANASNMAAGKGALTLDPKPAVAHAATVLEDREDLLPAEGQTVLAKLKAAADTGTNIPLKQVETWKTTIARASRKYDQAGDTNAVSALSDFRDSLEQMQPSNAATADVAAKFTNARSLAKSRFDELDADPAYKAAVGDEAPIGSPSDLADKFTDKYVLGAPKAALQRLRPKLDEEGHQAVTSSTMNFLQKKAGINPDTGAGNFSAKGYNNALTKITPKANELLGNGDLIDDTRKLGNVANYVQSHSRGSYANTSHTFVAAAAAHAANSLEGVANVAAHGIPVGTWARKYLANRSNAAALHESLKPGAGLEN